MNRINNEKDINTSQSKFIYLNYLIKYGIVISILTIFGGIAVAFSGDEEYTFGAWLLIIFFYIIISTPLAALGKYIAIMYGPSKEVLDELDIKWQIFWKYGIQILGWGIGVMIAGGYILPKFGIFTNRTY